MQPTVDTAANTLDSQFNSQLDSQLNSQLDCGTGSLDPRIDSLVSSLVEHSIDTSLSGIRFAGDAATTEQLFFAYLQHHQLEKYVAVTIESDGVRFSLDAHHAQIWTPQGNTTKLAHALKRDLGGNHDALEREIIVAMLAAPIAFNFASYQEFAAHVRIRGNIARAARLTQLAFDTEEVNRPTDCWRYSEASGFTVIPGQPLIPALKKATQPDTSGQLYAFSCYRATEYVILLGIAEELQSSNPNLLQQLQMRWETRAIMSAEFHEVFLHEYGSLNAPLPAGYYVPGDRLWFRNPDERSSDIAGYEGSWVIYMGGGLFCNFWKRDQPYTLARKCVEVFHWRDGAYLDHKGELAMNEAIVDAHVHSTLDNPERLASILQQMLRLRDPQGVYADGGCIDASREYPRSIYPATTTMVVPAA